MTISDITETPAVDYLEERRSTLIQTMGKFNHFYYFSLYRHEKFIPFHNLNEVNK